MEFKEFIGKLNGDDKSTFEKYYNICGVQRHRIIFGALNRVDSNVTFADVNVFVILDNGNWRNYNFEKLFTSEDFNNSVVKRTRKLFYVCCTRAKNNLAVYYKCPSQQVLDKAVEWFGEGNIIKIG